MKRAGRGEAYTRKLGSQTRLFAIVRQIPETEAIFFEFVPAPFIADWGTNRFERGELRVTRRAEWFPEWSRAAPRKLSRAHQLASNPNGEDHVNDDDNERYEKDRTEAASKKNTSERKVSDYACVYREPANRLK
jgi:hypothetical protein